MPEDVVTLEDLLAIHSRLRKRSLRFEDEEITCVTGKHNILPPLFHCLFLFTGYRLVKFPRAPEAAGGATFVERVDVAGCLGLFDSTAYLSSFVPYVRSSFLLSIAGSEGRDATVGFSVLFLSLHICIQSG